MIIKSISMSNFQCFHGSHDINSISFSDGINLIIGDNGQGKSKFWDAFYWVLYDQTFNSDTREFIGTSQYRENILSDKAKKECQVGEEIVAEVRLIAVDSRDIDYEITRFFRATKVSDREWQTEPRSTLVIRHFKVIQFEILAEEKHQSVLQRVLPGHLKPYMWFQGEQVDNLMDFKSKTSLTQAITLLSDIKIYDDLIAITKKGAEKAESAYNRALNRLSSDAAKSATFDTVLERLKKDIGTETTLLNTNKINNETAQIGLDELMNKIKGAEEQSTDRQEKDRLTGEITLKKTALNLKIENLNKNLFSSSWLLKDVQPIFNEYNDKYKAYIDSHHETKAMGKISESQLALDQPQPIFMDKMLAAEKCFVCGRDAHQGSEEFIHIQGVRDRERTEDKADLNNDCSTLFKRLYDNTVRYERTIKGINSSISGELKEIQSLKGQIIDRNARVQEIMEMFGELITDGNADNIIKEFRTHQLNRERFSQQVAENGKKIEELNKKRKEVETNRESLVVGEVNPTVKAANITFNKLVLVSEATRESVFIKLVKQLEDTANAIFQDMTKRNKSITGRLHLRVLDTRTCFPEIVDGDGHSLSGSNDSNIILVKLALMMAVLTSKNQWSQNYCLVSDAPTSKMSSHYSNGFYEALGKNFKQSIVMTYDFLSSEDRKQLKSFNIGKIYKIEANYPNGDRTNRDDLNINIQELG